MTKIYFKKQRNLSLLNHHFFIAALLLFFCVSSTNAQYFSLGSGLTATNVSSDGSIVVGDNGGQNFMWSSVSKEMLTNYSIKYISYTKSNSIQNFHDFFSRRS